MYIHLTEAAVERLAAYAPAPGDRFRLVYDAEGCGCAVSGVAGLWLTDAPDEDDVQADTNLASFPMVFLKRQEVFFDDRLRLDYSPERRAFRLSSDGQIYGNGIDVSDRRAATRTPEGAPR